MNSYLAARTQAAYNHTSNRERNSGHYYRANHTRTMWIVLFLFILTQSFAQIETAVNSDPFIKLAPMSPPTHTIPLTIVFSFSDKFVPAEKGHIVFGVYSSKEAYDVISALNHKKMTHANTKVSDELWNNYYRIEIPHSEKGNYTYQLNVDPHLPYVVSVFYDRDSNREFTFFSNPAENFGFSNYKKNMTLRKPRFEEIEFSPLDYQNSPLVIEMKP